MKAAKKRNSLGFTIVELLVVIVVIGILVAISVVSYSSISQKAVMSSLQSDLSSAVTILKMYQIDNSAYPTSVTNCPVPTTGNICLKASSGNSYPIYSSNNSSNPQTFSLTAINGLQSYTVTSNSKPTSLDSLASTPLTPVADWLATPTGDHYGNYFDLVTKQYATVSRALAKTIYDPSTNKIYDVPANKLAINPRSDSKNGSEAVIEESRRNYLLNSNFSTDSNSDGIADNWGEANSNTVGTKTYSITNNSLYGNTSQRIQYTGTSDSNTGFDFRSVSDGSQLFTAGDAVTESMFIKGSCNGSTVKLWAVGLPSYSTVVTSAAISLSNSWQRISVSGTVPAGDTRMYLYVQIRGIDAGDSLDINLAATQIEKGAFLTSYIPTTTTSVIRNLDTVTVPTTSWNTNAGTAFVVGSPASDQGTRPKLSWGSSGGDLLMMYNGWAYGSFSYFSLSGLGIYYKNQANPASMFVQTQKWTTTTVNGYINGTIMGTDNALPRAPVLDNTYATIGNGGPGPIQRIVIYNSALADADVSTVTGSIQNGP